MVFCYCGFTIEAISLYYNGLTFYYKLLTCTELKKYHYFKMNINFVRKVFLMSDLKRIREPISKELSEFETHFRSAIKSKVPLLDVITNYILRRKGKQLRPTFVFLTSSTLGGITPSSFTAASMIELLHTASLIHDDVVDESYERRGFFSLNALWRSKIAVLVGDYLLSRGLLLSVERHEYDLLQIVTEAVKEMSEGELLQLRKSRRLNITMEEYFEVIRKKTAALIAACTACGARAVSNDEDVIRRMKAFGENAGIAFQIKDDLFDYDRNGKIGKPTGNDIKEKKMTLPLIYALKQCTPSERNHIIHIVRRQNKNAKKVDEVLTFVEKHGGLDYAMEQMNTYKDKALEILRSFPHNVSRDSLEHLVKFTVQRKK